SRRAALAGSVSSAAKAATTLRGEDLRWRSNRSTCSRSCTSTMRGRSPIPREDVAASLVAPAEALGKEYLPVDFLYEPSPQEIFDQLLPRYVEVQVYRALLESNAAFFAAQMTAMD